MAKGKLRGSDSSNKVCKYCVHMVYIYAIMAQVLDYFLLNIDMISIIR